MRSRATTARPRTWYRKPTCAPTATLSNRGARAFRHLAHQDHHSRGFRSAATPWPVRRPRRSNANAIVEHTEPGARSCNRGASSRGWVEGAVDALPAVYRAVFVLRDVEGLSTAETAASLDIPEQTAKTRLHPARTLLRNHLSGPGVRRSPL